eukprot:4342110-Lingulodinium_polyedra.AAC.1
MAPSWGRDQVLLLQRQDLVWPQVEVEGEERGQGRLLRCGLPELQELGHGCKEGNPRDGLARQAPVGPVEAS